MCVTVQGVLIVYCKHAANGRNMRTHTMLLYIEYVCVLQYRVYMCL